LPPKKSKCLACFGVRDSRKTQNYLRAAKCSLPARLLPFSGKAKSRPMRRRSAQGKIDYFTSVCVKDLDADEFSIILTEANL
jgi:hypothetical protein